MKSREFSRPEVVAISVSESPDMATLGLGELHLKNAIADLAIFMLAERTDLAYGGDLRKYGFARLLFQLAHRYARGDDGDAARIVNYLAWPVHIQTPFQDLEETATELSGVGRLDLLGIDGSSISMECRRVATRTVPTDDQWCAGLTAMRQVMRENTDLRILVGGRVEGYKGSMPGVAEEALLSLSSGQALFLVGSFGGCTHDIAATLGLVDPFPRPSGEWKGRSQFRRFGPADLNNGLTLEENQYLADVPYFDDAIVLLLKGLNRLRAGANVTD